jgi:hypothetical protein
MNAAELYTGQMHAKSGYLAMWPPGAPLTLGDVGEFDGRAFVGRSNLATKGVPFEVLCDPAPDIVDQYSTAEAVHRKIKVGGKAELFAPTIPLREAGVVLEFSRGGAVWYVARDSRYDRIADIDALEPLIKGLHDRQQWNLDWVVVTHVMTAARCTIVVATEAGANIELKLVAGFNIGPLGDADLSTGFEYVNGRDLATYLIAEKATPLYRAMRLTRFRHHLVQRAPGRHFAVEPDNADRTEWEEWYDGFVAPVDEEDEEDDEDDEDEEEEEGPTELQLTEVTW